MLALISLCFGGVIAGGTMVLYRIFRAVPDENRSLLDQPAKGFRLVWPLILAYCHYFGAYLSQGYRLVTDLKLKKGGVQYSISPEQFFAAKVICSIIGFLTTLLFLVLLGFGQIIYALPIAIASFYYPDLWLKETISRRQSLIVRSLPFYLDVIVLSIESGTNLTGGLTQAVQKSGESPLRAELSRVLRDVRSGKTRADSLREMSERAGTPALSSVINGMIQAERNGSSLAPVLRAQADQLRTNRFLKAEKLAMEAPVKLLGPLITFIFPTTFLVLGFVLLSKAVQSRIITWEPLLWAYHWPG